MSTRTEFNELVKKYEHTAIVKKYGGITRKFIMLFSRSVPSIKENEKQVMSLVAAKKETNDGESSDWLLSIDIRSYFVMEDGVVRPTQIGIEDFNQSPIMEARKSRKPYQKKDNAVNNQKAKAADNDIGDLFSEWANWMENFRTKMQKLN